MVAVPSQPDLWRIAVIFEKGREWLGRGGTNKIAHGELAPTSTLQADRYTRRSQSRNVKTLHQRDPVLEATAVEFGGDIASTQ